MNPAIQHKDKMILYREKDLLTGKEYIIPRYTELTLAFQDCIGKTKCMKFNYPLISFTNATASAVISRILSNSPAAIISPFTIQLPPQATSLLYAR